MLQSMGGKHSGSLFCNLASFCFWGGSGIIKCMSITTDVVYPNRLPILRLTSYYLMGVLAGLVTCFFHGQLERSKTYLISGLEPLPDGFPDQDAEPVLGSGKPGTGEGVRGRRKCYG